MFAARVHHLGSRGDAAGVKAGGTLFLIFADFSEGVLNISRVPGGSDLARYGLPVVLIVVGAFVLLRRGGQART